MQFPMNTAHTRQNSTNWGFCKVSICEGFDGVFLGFRKLSRKVCISWALPLNKRVGVSACKIHMPDTHVFVLTKFNPFLLIYWNSKKISIGPLYTSTWFLPKQLLVGFGDFDKSEKSFVTCGFWVRRYVALVVSVPIPLRNSTSESGPWGTNFLY